MATTDHTQQYSAADIQRYLDGNMSAADMHALEKAALDDPFLADAIEGLQQTREQHDASLITANLQDISRRVDERTKKEDRKTRVIAFRWWQVAAAAVVIIAGGIGVYQYFGQSPEAAATNTQVAQVETLTKKADSAAPVVPPAEATTDTVSITNGIVGNNDWKAANTPRPVAKAATNTADRRSAAYKADEQNIKQEDIAANAQAAPAKQDDHYFSKSDSVTVAGYGTKKAPQPLVAAKQQAEYEQIVIPKTKRDSLAKDYYTKPRGDLAMNPSNKELSELSERQLNRELKKNPNALLSGFIKGRVADQNNNPLYNAVVRVGDQQDFLTDKQGFFKIPASDSMVKVAVGYNGFYTQNLRLQNNTTNNITLNQLGVKPPNPQLNVIQKADTVTFNSTARAKARPSAFFGEGYTKGSDANITAQNAQPEYGWLEYHQYLDKNKKLPSDNDDAIAGKVVVSFQVNKKGMLSDFKIEQSLRKDYDEEAIRLIKAGPSWKLTKGHRARATVVVNF